MKTDSEYQLQLNGNAVNYYAHIGPKQIEAYLKLSNENPDARVELVRITKDVIYGGYDYAQMEKHFSSK